MAADSRNASQAQSATTGNGRFPWRRMSRNPGVRGPKDHRRGDARIREQLGESLAKREDLDSSDVSIDVLEGIVTLFGTVPVRWMKHAIEDLAADTPGVIDVDNQIRVAAPIARPLLDED